MKVCGSCKKEKAFELFSRKGNNYQSWCKQCNTENKKAWIAKNRDKVRQNILWTKYRLKPETWEQMWSDQNGLCAVCEEIPPTIVDHNHACCSGSTSCGKCVRALVCNRCNIFLGMIECNPGLTEKAFKFLGI